MNDPINAKPMLNAYPDSLGGTLSDIAEFLEKPEMRDVFSSFYILPSVFNTDLDRGFSVIDYDLNDLVAQYSDLERIHELGIDFKFDFILNHGSVLSPQFQDLIRHGEASPYRDFFIRWNEFWEGYGPMGEQGYIEPEEVYIKEMFFRKPGMPILMVRMPDGREEPYWNTFYQKVSYRKPDTQEMMCVASLQYLRAEKLVASLCETIESGKHPKDMDWSDFESEKDIILNYMESTRRYLGQMDLNIESPIVWNFYEDTLNKLAGYGASLVRLDAFAYAPKKPGEKNFLNEPGTWELLEKVRQLADPLQLTLLPEIHSKYLVKTHETIAEKGYMTYDFFLPGLVIDALESGSKENLESWADELVTKGIRTVNMLGCHDGIPLLDLEGLLDDDRIMNLMNLVIKRGGLIKELHGQKNAYYQVNATYYSALGREDEKLLLARAIQLFMPGKPQIWYLDLFAGENDRNAVMRAGAGGHKEINRTNLKREEILKGLEKSVVRDQLELIRFRNNCEAFGFDSKFTVYKGKKNILYWTWTRKRYRAVLQADLISNTFKVEGYEPDGTRTFNYVLNFV